MAKELYGLTAEQVERIAEGLRVLEGSDQWGRTKFRGPPKHNSRVIIGALTSAASPTTALLGKPKVATLNVYTFTSTGVEDTGVDEKVYNFAPQTATTDRWTVAERDDITGKWIITTQFCS